MKIQVQTEHMLNLYLLFLTSYVNVSERSRKKTQPCLKWGGRLKGMLDPRQCSMQDPRMKTLVVMGDATFFCLRQHGPWTPASIPLGKVQRWLPVVHAQKWGVAEGLIPTKINPVTQASWHPWAQIHQLIPFKVKITDSIFLSFIVVKSSPPCFHSHIRL